MQQVLLSAPARRHINWALDTCLQQLWSACRMSLPGSVPDAGETEASQLRLASTAGKAVDELSRLWPAAVYVALPGVKELEGRVDGGPVKVLATCKAARTELRTFAGPLCSQFSHRAYPQWSAQQKHSQHRSPCT